MTTKVLLLVATKKGVFMIESDRGRARWEVRGPFCETWPMFDATYDPASSAVYAAGGSEWYGPAVWRSTDLGRSWTHSSQGLTYGDEGPGIATVWSVLAAHGAVYAGTDPAGLFRSDDGGVTWQHVTGLREHPSRPSWQPGAGGLCLHSIVPHPTDRRRMWVGISAVGTFATADGGRTWETRNRGVRAEFLPERYPELGQCVHRLGRAPGEADLLYQQNHCGVYRSGDGGRAWAEVSDGLPSDFGFAMAVHPREPRTVYVIPLNGDGRFMPDAAAAVWRTRDGGDTWARLDHGLPQRNAYLGVLRQAMAIDPLDPAGVYFGTTTGQLFASADEGEHWMLVAEYLPPVRSVGAALIED